MKVPPRLLRSSPQQLYPCRSTPLNRRDALLPQTRPLPPPKLSPRAPCPCNHLIVRPAPVRPAPARHACFPPMNPRPPPRLLCPFPTRNPQAGACRRRANDASRLRRLAYTETAGSGSKWDSLCWMSTWNWRRCRLCTRIITLEHPGDLPRTEQGKGGWCAGSKVVSFAFFVHNLPACSP